MEVVSGIGDGVFWVGPIALLLDLGVGVEGFAVAALVRLGPRAILSATAGVLADRVDRRRLLVALDIGRAAVMLVLAVASGGDDRLTFAACGSARRLHTRRSVPTRALGRSSACCR